MTGRGVLGPLLSLFLVVAILDGGLAGAQPPPAGAARTLLDPFARKTIAGEVMSVDQEKRTLVVRVLKSGEQARDLSFALDERTVVKKLRTPISGGDLSPGHLVKVTYREHAGKLVARHIEVTGKAVHPAMP